MKMPKYSVIVPVYNSSATLIAISERIKAFFAERPQVDYELIYVNDSPFSRTTCETLAKLVEENSHVVVIELMKNFGQQEATLCGIEHSCGDYIITMDDDLQHAPEDIALLMNKQHHDVVVAKYKQKKHSRFKCITSSIKGYFDYLLLGKPYQLKLTPFRLISRHVSRLMLERKTSYPFIPALFFSVTDDVVNVELDHYERQEGKGSYTLFKLIKIFSNLLINNSSFLLRLVGYVGISSAFFSFFYGASIIFKKVVYGHTALGWSSIMVAVLFFGGTILFALGVVGEYLIRIIVTAEQRPTYYVRKVVKQ
ncbi:MAG: glycosyltransferase [Proteobacteria bacterium]|nr:glycosyltransferase [Pseudomonadota bacterium]